MKYKSLDIPVMPLINSYGNKSNICMYIFLKPLILIELMYISSLNKNKKTDLIFVF